MSVPLENHLVQCLKNISKKYLKQYENSFFIPLTTSVHIDLDKLTEPQKLNLNLNQIPPPNLISFPQINIGQIEDKIEQLLDNCEYQGMNDSLQDQNKQNEIVKVFQDFQTQTLQIQLELISIEKMLEKLDRDDQYLEQIMKKKKLNEDLKKINESKQIFISSNLQTIMNHARKIYEKQIELNNEQAFLISVFNSFQEQISGPQSLVYSKCFYDSSQESLELFPKESREQQLSEILSQFGMGEQADKSKLPNSIGDIFEKIIFQCDSASVFFERKWLPIDIIQNNKIGIKSSEINQWSNGSQFQQATGAAFPYMIVGAVICKNIKIEGFKTDKKMNRMMNRIQIDGDHSNVLIFKLKSDLQNADSYKVQVDPHIIQINSPNIIGYILQPLMPFPQIIYIDQVFPIDTLKRDIQEFLDSNISHEEIINSYEDDSKIINFNNWRQQIQDIINKLQSPIIDQIKSDSTFTETIQIDPSLTEILPKISEYFQKKNLIQRFKDKEKLNLDKDKNDKQIQMLYKGIIGQDVRLYIEYYQKYQILTNKLDSVFEEEKQEFEKIINLKKQNNEIIDFEDLSIHFLIHKKVIEELYEEKFEPIPLQIHPLIEERRSEIIEFQSSNYSQQDILDFYQSEKNIFIIPKWKEQIIYIINDSKLKEIQIPIEEILEQKKDEILSYIESNCSNEMIIDCLSHDQQLTCFQNWDQNVIQFINQIKESLEPIIPGMKEKLPYISQFEQKQRLIDHLKNKKHENSNFNEIAKMKLFGVQGDNYKAYINYYIEYKCITNNIEQIFNQEKDQLNKFDKNEINLKQISEQTLIHPQLLKAYYNIQDEIKLDEIEEYIVQQRDQIQQLIEQQLEKEDIVEIFKGDDQIKRIFKWQPKLELIIDQIIQENSIPDQLPVFDNYQQKSVLIQKIISNELEKDLKKGEQELQVKYKGLKKETAKKCFIYFQIKQKYLSNTINEVMDEEIAICNESFLKLYGQPIDIQQISQETLIEPKVIQEILNKFNQKPIVIPDIIEELREEIDQCLEAEMDFHSIVEHYKKTRKDIQKIKNWEIFINIIIKSLKKFDSFIQEEPNVFDNEDVQLVFNEETIDHNENQQINLPLINFNQKQFIVEQFLKLGEKAFKRNPDYPTQLLKQRYCGLTNEQIQSYLQVYENNKIITLRIQDLLPEEKQQIIEEFKLQKNIDIYLLSRKYLIAESVIEDIYKKDFFNNDLISIFQQATNMDEQQIKEILQNQHDQAKDILVDIFKHKTELYDQVKYICNEIGFCPYLMDNIIENYLTKLRTDDKQKMKKHLNQLADEDPILLIKILRSLEGQNADESEIENDEDPLRIKEKTTKILKTNKSDDLITVYAKADYNSQFQNIEEAAKESKQYEMFEKNIIQKLYPKKISMLLNDFDQIENSNENEEKKNQKFDKLFKQNYNIHDNNAYKYIKQHSWEINKIEEIKLKQQNEQKDQQQNQIVGNQEYEYIDDDNEEEKQINFLTLSEFTQKTIVLHKSDNLSEYTIFGKQYQPDQLHQIIHMVYDSKNSKFTILKVNHEISISNSFNVNIFKQNYPNIYTALKPWIQQFIGYKSLFKFIYDKESKQYIDQNIKILEDLIEQYKKYEKNQEDLYFLEVLNICSTLADTQIFQEWFNKIEKTDVGKIFTKKFDFYWSRTNVKRQIYLQEKIKKIFPNPTHPLNLRDFNRLRGRKDKNQVIESLKKFMNKNNPIEFLHEVIQQIFGFINRRESVQQLVSQIKELKILDEISTRFLISLILQQSNIELRSRLIYYLSEYYSVPLIMICQTSYQNGQQNLIYLPEIAFEMLEGTGVLNFGAGNKCLQTSGKSQMLNDILFPSNESQHQAFEQGDKNIFSNGQIDVFFEKSYDFKRNMVIMDGQGNLNDQAIISVLQLTNIVLINFYFAEFNEADPLKDLGKKVQMIKEQDSNIQIVLVIRDAQKSDIFDLSKKLTSFVNKKNTQCVKLVEKLQGQIDYCLTLVNLNTFDKINRLLEMIPILQIFNKLTDNFQNQLQKHKFSKQNFLQKFLNYDKANQQNIQIIKKAFFESDKFIQEVEKIKNNIFQDSALPVLDLKNQIRQQVLEIRNRAVQLQVEEAKSQNDILDINLEQLKSTLREKKPTQILESFHKIILDENSSLILNEISKKLRKITSKQLEEPISRKDKLIKQQQEEQKKNQIVSKEEINKRNEDYKQKIKDINMEIYRKSISIEYFWRCLVFYLGQDTDCDQFNNKTQKSKITNVIDNLLKNGDCYELIDGENLEFKGQFIKDVIESSKKDRVIVVCVIGPQSSGKSTLMNFSFGTQFFTSSGRCTKGIYFTLQKFPDDIPNEAGVRWLLMLDTEGLQSPEKIDDEYDRKIVLFAMLSANVLIINNKGEINAQMINTLKMCCVTFDMLKRFASTPKIMYTYGQNNDLCKDPFVDQVQMLRQEVIDATDSPTIENTAEELLGYDRDKINVFGFAYNGQVFQKEESIGLQRNISFKIGQTNFGVQTSEIFKQICEIVKNKSLKFFEISHWLDEAQQNWNLIDRYSGNINAFQNLEEFKNEQKVQRKMYNLWINYLKDQQVVQNDEILCSGEKIKLMDIFQKYGQVQLDQEIVKVDQRNQAQKDQDLQKYVFEQFEDWQREPAQKQVTVESVRNHRRLVIARMDVVKNEFKMKLLAKIKEEQMLWINKNGVKKIINKAYEISKDQSYQSKSNQEQNKYLQQQFEECWKEQIKEMIDQAQIDKMILTYYNDLMQTFKVYNKFIQDPTQIEFEQLRQRIQNNVQDSNQINFDFNTGLEELIVNELNIKQNKIQFRMFQSNNEMLFQMKEDPKERIFDLSKKEEFLKLQEIVLCTYEYVVIKDLQKQIDKKYLENEMYNNLTIQKEEVKQYQQSDYYGNSYNKSLIKKIDDQHAQISYLKLLLLDLNKAGFNLNQKNNYLLFTTQQTKNLKDIEVEELFKDKFSAFYGKDQLTQKNQKKKEWIKEFVKTLEFQASEFQEISSRIQSIFATETVKIKDINNPFQSLTDHQKLQTKEGKILRDSLYVSEAKIIYEKHPDAKSILNNHFKTLINPKTSENDMVSKQRNLSLIAQRQLQWTLIAKKIIEAVKIVLKINISESKNQPQEEVNIQQIMELNQMTNQQVMTLESEHLGTKLREKIDQELQQKLGIQLSHEMSAQISWSALIVCWIQLFEKAKKTFNKQLEQFKKEEGKHFEMFKQIINGNMNSVTEQNIKSLIEMSFKKLEDAQRQQAKKDIMDELTKIKKDFDNFSIYEYLDNFYLALNHQAEIKAFIQYVHDPIQVFEDKVDEMKQQKIDIIILNYSNKLKQLFNDNLYALQDIFAKLKQQKDKAPNHWGQVANYFEIQNDNNKILNFEEKQELNDHLSPVIYMILRQIISGVFTMNPFQYTLKDQNGVENHYLFTPFNLNDQGPLEIFTDPQLQANLQNILNKQSKNYFINEFLNVLKNFENDQQVKIFQIDVIIEIIIITIQNQIGNIGKIGNYTDKWFECETQIEDLVNQAIGCKSCCLFCNRKCELKQHVAPQDRHTCETVGHQLRVFAGGHFINSQGKVYPSLGTCDTIKSDTPMLIDGQKTTWEMVLEQQMSYWNVQYKAGEQNIKAKLIIFEKFWQTVGKQYCIDKKMEYIDKYVPLSVSTSQTDPGVIVICLDESGSMQGNPWNNVVKGAKDLIDFVKSDHKNPQSVQLVIISFNNSATMRCDQPLSTALGANVFQFGNGGTDFGPSMKMGMDYIQKYIGQKQTAKFYFFTDGGAAYPSTQMQQIDSVITNNKAQYIDQQGQCKLQILLMSEERNNATLLLIKDKFNEVSKRALGTEICQLQTAVDTSKVGQFMIESFKFNT